MLPPVPADQESRIKQQQPAAVFSAAAFLIHRARAVLKLAPFASNLSLSDSIQFDGPRCCPRRSATVVPLETPLLLLVLRDAVDDGAHVRPRRVVLIRREITSSCFIYSVSDDCPLFVGRRECGPGEELES